MPAPQDPSQFDPATWVHAHGDALFRYALLRVRDREAAEELVQECFVAALAARSRFDGRCSERTWLIGILKHKIIDHHRRRSREGQTIEEPVDSRGPSGEFNDRGLWKTGPRRWRGTPDRDLRDGEFRAVLRGCIAALPQSLADAFLLREIDHLESEEVCKILEISPTNLWARLHRARLALRRCLEQRWFGSKRSS